MRLAVPIAIVALAAALASGCGGSESDSTATGPSAAPKAGAATAPAGASAQACGNLGGAQSVRATGISCGRARPIVVAWTSDDGCVGSQGISHIACTVESYRCIATRTERGVSVSCARPGRSIAFTSRR